MTKRIGLIFLLWVLIAGCATGPDSRIGNNGLSADPEFSEYPPGRYMRVKGMGESEPEARRRALSEMAGIFESDIQSEINTRAESIIEDESETFEKSVRETIRIKSSVRLPGLRIAGTWKADGYHYALAVLDKAACRRIWMEQIEALEHRIAGETRSYQGNLQNRLMKLRSANTIMSLWIEKQVLKSRLRVIGLPYPEAFEDDIGPIIASLPEILSKMRIFVDISGTGGDTIRDRIAEGLTREGFIVSAQNSGADVLIRGESSIEEIDMDRPKWQFVRASVSVDITDSAADSRVAEITEKVRAAHLNYGEASQKAIREVSAQVARKIVNSLMMTDE